MKKIFIASALLLIMGSCTQNERVKQFGGTGTLKLPSGQKLVNITWKGTELWYLTRSMNIHDSVETYEFAEESSFGIVEGKFVIVESK